MKISDYAIRHPSVIGIVLIALSLFGILSVRGMKRDLLANISLPELLVLTVYPGASPDAVERDVTEPLENEFSLIAGVSRVSSESHNGYSMIFVTMEWDADIEAKKNDLRDKMNNALGSLPDEISGPPRLYELVTSSLPVYSVLVESDYPDAQLSRLLDEQLVPRFSRISDVSAVYARGVEGEAVRVSLIPGRLESLDVTALEAFAAVARGQATIPAGDVLLGADRLALSSDGDYANLAQIETQPVGYGSDGIRIQLDDVAKIYMGTQKPEFRVLSNGHRTVVLDVMKREGGDTDGLIENVKALQKVIESEHGNHIKFKILVDDSETIGLTLGSVTRSAWLGGLLALFILLLFLHNFRAALIVSLSIPFTVFLTLILMRARSMSLNIMSLAGITVSIGMMVDSSIVILENTVRHRNSGMAASQAASLGASEVGGAVLASTSTSLSVFIPILFLSGFAGAILKEVSYVLVFALSSSALTAVIIVPWLSSRFLDFEDSWGPLARFGLWFDQKFDVFVLIYTRFLKTVLKHKKFTLLLAAILLASSVALVGMLGAELFAAPDMNEFEISVTLPAGYNLEKTESKVEEIARLVRRETPEIEDEAWYAGLADSGTIIESGNPSTAYGRFRLSRSSRRERSVFQIISRLRSVLVARIPDAQFVVRNGGLAKKLSYATAGEGFRVELSGADWNDVLEAATAVQFLMEADPLVESTDLGIRLDRELLAVKFNREDTGRLAVNPVAAGQTLRILFAGEEAGTLRSAADSYPIIVDSPLSGAPLPPGILANLSVRNAVGESVPFSAFTAFERQSITDRIPHVNRLPSITVAAQLSENDLAAVRSRIEPILSHAELPPGVSWRIAGAADLMGDTFRDLAFSLAISIFLVYAVMVIQFERFSQPFIIMAAVPFVLIGVALSLAAFGNGISIVSFFGIIALGGMVVNNAIVLVEFTNQRRAEGSPLREAVLEAARIRLKPILITTLTTILGLIPLAFAVGEGSEIYAPLGQVIGGGLLTSTLITLALVPALYELAESRREEKNG